MGLFQKQLEPVGRKIKRSYTTFDMITWALCYGGTPGNALYRT